MHALQIEEYVVEVYRMSLRAIDDVKETVRKAGTALNRAVSGLCTKLADPSQSDAVTAEKVCVCVCEHERVRVRVRLRVRVRVSVHVRACACA